MKIKHILYLGIGVVAYSFWGGFAYAASISVVEAPHTGLFGLETVRIDEVSSTTKDTRFVFRVNDHDSANVISEWKLRVWCEEGVRILDENSAQDLCGKAVRLHGVATDTFSLLMDNQTDKTVGFYFKLKAYDVNGTWLHSERKSFRWR